jgi:uncharacterized protein YcaQ
MLSLGEARRLAVRSQHLAGPPVPAGIDGMRQVLRGLRVLQIDPVNVVARSHLLVLWSRLGGFDRDDLDTLLWRERWLFEYWAHAASIVLTGTRSACSTTTGGRGPRCCPRSTT